MLGAVGDDWCWAISIDYHDSPSQICQYLGGGAGELVCQKAGIVGD